MNNTKTQNTILIRNNFLQLPKKDLSCKKNLANAATIVSNMNYYGYMPSFDVFESLMFVDHNELIQWWSELELTLKTLTGEDRNMSDFVVYKNFPSEVMGVSDAERFFKQILIYFGVPYDMVREEEQSRPELTEKVTYKVLQEAPEDVFTKIFESLVGRVNKWNQNDEEMATYLFLNNDCKLVFSDFKFKENASFLSRIAYENNKEIEVTYAMDVLRMSLNWAGLSEKMPVSQIKFKSFPRKERKFLLALLEETHSLENDIRIKQKVWKKLFARLNPSDYKFKNVQAAYDKIYNKKAKSVEAVFKKLLKNADLKAMDVALENSVGFYVRNIHLMYNVFGNHSFLKLAPSLDKLTIKQLVELESYVRTVNSRKIKLIAPKGNWSKAQLIENNKKKFDITDIEFLISQISRVMNEKLSVIYPDGISLSKETSKIKLPTNDVRLGDYGRGTEFDIPKNIRVLRTGSYWVHGIRSNTWFDNGWSFFNDNFEFSGSCDWCSSKDGALFSGDPLPSSDAKGKGCQVIDLDLEKLEANGVRYAMWSILSYSNVPFDQAEDVFGTFQFCEDHVKGGIFEPSRAEFAFDIKDKSLSKYVAYVDIKERKVVFLDAGLPNLIHSVGSNRYWSGEQLQAMIEYNQSRPSIFDVFKHLKTAKIFKEQGVDSIDVDSSKPLIGFSDKILNFNSDEQVAYLLKHTNESNKFERINVLDLLSK